MKEVWKDVIGFEGIYKVSNYGRVKSLERDIDYGNRICHRKERLLKQHRSTDGYLMVKLKDNKNHNVHRLVAEAFLGKQEGFEVNHINAIRMDNRLENLEWVTHHENILHMYKLGNDCLTGKKYENNYNSKSILLKNDKGEILRFNCIKLCIEWLQSKYNLKTDNLYAILKKYSMNNIPFYGYRIEYL